MYRQFFTMAAVFLIAGAATASQDTIGDNGIMSAGLLGFDGQPLTGANVGIGEVQPFRPADPTFDTNPTFNNSFVKPAAVFFHTHSPDNFTPIANTGGQMMGPLDTGSEAERVASVMISQDTTDPDGTGPRTAPTGVAPNAKLYAAGINAQSVSTQDDEAALTSQFINTQNGGDIRAINMSFGDPLINGHVLDGNSDLSLYVDWSATHDDTLYTIAGNETGPSQNNPIPTDSFNNIVVNSSTKINGTGKYTKVSTSNDYSLSFVGGRTPTDLIAPGVLNDSPPTGFDTDDLNQSVNQGIRLAAGTSYAAPHVAGTIALLQQYGNQRSTAGTTKNWSSDYIHHQVMKAVLMNSADKINDNSIVVENGYLPVPNGGFLGQSTTVFMQDGTSTWLNSPANDDDVNFGDGQVALDPQMGTGQLNAKRALTQLAAGEHQSFQASPLDYSEVPVIGWDYGHTRPLGVNSQNVYKFNQKLVAGSFISITLTFDRTVVKSGSATTYNTGDTFTPSADTTNPGEDQLTDLDLYLLPKNSNSISDAIAFSDAFGTVDHIFFQIPTTDEYEFWVREFNNNAGPENYAVAWWADGTGPLTFGRGDVNQDGHVDAKDIAAMEQALTNESGYANSIGMTTDELSLYGDVNGDGIFNAADLQALLNLLKSGGGSTSVPEPASFLLLAIGGVAMLRSRRIARR